MLIKENNKFREITNAVRWHDKGYTGKSVNIVLLDDGGTARKHMKKYYEMPIGSWSDKVGHSTNVGNVAHEFAPDARIIALDWQHKSSEALEWIKDNADKIDLINVSLAGTGGAVTPQFIALKDLDIPLICASGNDAYDDRISYPARYDWTIAIGACQYNYSTDTYDNIARYSNQGAMIDAVAFTGINVMTDEGKVFTFNGTSCAAPTATGLLACYVQWRKEQGLPKLTTEEARQFIRSNTKDLYEKGFDTKSGMGLFILLENIPQKEAKDMKIEMFIGKNVAIKNGKEVSLNIAPKIKDGRTMLGIRDVAELLDCKVEWDAGQRKVTITKEVN